MAAAPARLADAARRSGFVVLAVPFALLLASTFRLAWVPLWVPTALAALAFLASLRPSEALLIVAALTPIAQYGGTRWNGAVNWPETMVVAFASGWALHQAWRAPGTTAAAIVRPAVFFAAVVIAGVLVELTVVQMRLGGSGLARALWEHLTREYFFNRGAFRALHTGALLLEGLVLLVAAVQASAVVGAFRRRAAIMLVLGAGAAAALNVLRLLEVALRAADPAAAFMHLLATQRINIHHSDPNAAGSHFAMVIFVAAALATSGQRRAIWGGAAALLTFALWITGSRAAVLCAVVAAVLVPLVRYRISVRRSAVGALAALILLAGGALLVAYAPMRGNQRGVTDAIDTRVGLAMTSVRMLRENPLFGIGLGEFYQRSGEFSSPELLRLFPAAVHENAHNNYLQIMAEQGLLGLAAFLWTLGAALVSGLRRLRVEASGLALGCAAGVCAFLLTCLAGHPLLIHQPAYAFWILLGVVGGGAAPTAGTRGWIVPLLVLLVLVSVIPRANAQRNDADVEHVGIGVSAWQMSGDGVRYRWAERQATVFVPGRVNGFLVRLRTERAPAAVELLLDGRPANVVRVTSDRWAEVRTLLPRAADAPRFRRLDVRIIDAAEAGRLLVGRVEPF